MREKAMERSARPSDDVALELREVIQKATPDQARVGDRARRGTERTLGDHRSVGAGAAGHTRDARRLQRFGQTHRRQDGGQPTRQHRLAHSWWAQEEDVVGRTPA